MAPARDSSPAPGTTGRLPDTPAPGPSSTPGGTEPPGGGRKQRTRESLLRTALELFTTQGYEDTTVDEIAAAVGVSQRTFFRHFSSKEDAVFLLQDEAEAQLVMAVRRRPAAEGPLEALRAAVLEGWDSVGCSAFPVPVELHMRAYRLIESTPSLLATRMRRSAEAEEGLARVVAERAGVDVDEDPRPRLLVAAFGGVMRLTGRLWSAAGEDSVLSIQRLIVAHLELFGPALAGEWDSPPGHAHASGAGHRA